MPKTILIVEDDDPFRASLVQILSKHFSETRIEEARNGAEALSMLETTRFQFLITDLRMPGLDGMSLIQALNGLPSEKRPGHTIVVSGFSDPESQVNQIGRISFFPKPLQKDALLKYIEVLDEQTPMPSTTSSSSTIDLSFVAPFIEGCKTVFEAAAGLELRHEVISRRKSGEPCGDVSSVIVFNSERLAGSFSISFDERTFSSLVSRILGDDAKTLSSGGEGVAGELCNQVYGAAKRILVQQGYRLPLSLPSVVKGANHSILHYVKDERVAVVFQSDIGLILLECAAQAKN